MNTDVGLYEAVQSYRCGPNKQEAKLGKDTQPKREEVGIGKSVGIAIDGGSGESGIPECMGRETIWIYRELDWRGETDAAGRKTS